MPISSGLKPRRALPMVAQAALSVLITWCDVICSLLSWRQTVQTGVSSVVPGYVQILLTSRAHCFTGHKTGSSVRPWMTVLCLWSLFCFSNVTATLSPNSKLFEGVERRRPSLKIKKSDVAKLKKLCMFHFPSGTFKYSHEQQAKKAAPMVSCEIALSSSDTCLFANSSRTQKGRAFCCTSLGSSLR